jgi:hypothetical protein
MDADQLEKEAQDKRQQAEQLEEAAEKQAEAEDLEREAKAKRDQASEGHSII